MYDIVALMLVVLLHASVCVHSALYEDQIGLFDWHREGLGEVTHAVFPSKNSKDVKVSKALYVASRANVLAKLDSKTSAVEWRHVLPESSIDALHFADSHASVVTLSTSTNNALTTGNATVVRQWDAVYGRLLWETNLPASSSSSSSFAKVHEVRGENEVDETRLVVVRNQGVTILGLKRGDVLRTVPFKSTTFLASLISSKVSADGSKLYILGTTDKAAASPVVLQVVLKSGALSTLDVASPAALHRTDDEDIVVAVGVNPDGAGLTLQSLDNLTKPPSIASPASLQLPYPADVSFSAVDASLGHALVASLSNDKRVFLRIAADLSVQVVASLPSSGSLVDSVQAPGALFHVALDASRNLVSVTSHYAGAASPSFTASLDVALYGGSILRGFAGVAFKKKGAALSLVRVGLVFADASLVLVSNEKPADAGPVWIREEALAHVTQMYWVTPTFDSVDQDKSLKVIPTYWEELGLELKKLVKFASSLSTLWSATDTTKHSSTFGFAKLLVLYTSTGKLYGLDSQTGAVAWSRFLGPGHQLLVTRDHPAFGAGAELLVVTPQSKQLLWLDAGDGSVVHEDVPASSSSGVKWVVLLPKLKHVELDATVPRRVVGVLDDATNHVDLFPADEDVRDHVQSFYVHRYNPHDHAFQGFVLASTTAASPVWSVALPANERIVARSVQPEHRAIDSSVTVLGDDSLLLKYLNPHLFGVATIDDHRVLHVSLIDGVSGRIVHRVKHRDAAEPVHLVQSENWLVYSYWNTKSKRTELVSLTLVEGGVPANGLNPWKQPRWASAKSSFEPKLPVVLQKTFVYPASISALGVTVTNQGITPQYILVAQSNGQIFKLARNFIDPRVPDGAPTPEQIRCETERFLENRLGQMMDCCCSEGLFQYTPYVPVLANALNMVTYNQTIRGIRRLVTAPALLESTSLTFAYGLDLYYVRLAPANAFDVLPSDFNFELLLLLCLGFIGGAYLTSVLADRKELHDAWK
ncbi:hypothetical protein DYB30_000035 [Aphanomyces astaci]|uniref:ER membrane protein complex subunit 1 n=1 Tax=Aphanomyces astaci TaxID=112090 RepID=A0A397E939_APHAT|nr:hypothetical protein DYB30_000035 [Aphanomyces astaci]